MKKVYYFFCKLIAEINEELSNSDSCEREELDIKLKEATKMWLIVSEYIDWDDDSDEEE